MKPVCWRLLTLGGSTIEQLSDLRRPLLKQLLWECSIKRHTSTDILSLGLSPNLWLILKALRNSNDLQCNIGGFAGCTGKMRIALPLLNRLTSLFLVPRRMLRRMPLGTELRCCAVIRSAKFRKPVAKLPRLLLEEAAHGALHLLRQALLLLEHVEAISVPFRRQRPRGLGSCAEKLVRSLSEL